MSLSFLSNIFIALLLLGLSSGNSIAQENCSSNIQTDSLKKAESSLNEDCAPIGEWQFGLSLGIGLRSNPLLDGDDIPLIVLPTVSYYGENFFINNLDMGYTIVDEKNWTVNLLTTPGLDNVFFERWDIGNFFVDIGTNNSAGLDSGDANLGTTNQEDRLTEVSAFDLNTRKLSWLAGIETQYQTSSGDLWQLSVLQDISDVHQGKEIRFAWATPISNSNWNATLGFTWKDQKTTNYYFGLAEDEITDDRAAYTAKSSFNPFVRLSWRESIENDSPWRFSIEYQKLGDAINDSPILNEGHTISFFVGKQFDF